MKKSIEKIKKWSKKKNCSTERKEIKAARIATLFLFVFGIFLSLRDSTITGNAILSSDAFLKANLIGALLTLISLALLILLSRKH